MIVDDFPLTPSGKVQKYVLRERFLATGHVPPAAGGPDIPATTMQDEGERA
jgi:hypothetical protein